MSPPKHTAKRELEFGAGSVICMSIAQVHIKPGTTVCVSLVQTRPSTGQHNCRKSCQAHFTMDCRCHVCFVDSSLHHTLPMRGTCSNIWSKGKLRVTMSFSLITLNNVVFHFLVQSLALTKAMKMMSTFKISNKLLQCTPGLATPSPDKLRSNA